LRFLNTLYHIFSIKTIFFLNFFIIYGTINTYFWERRNKKLKVHKKSAFVWLGIHFLILLAILLFPFYRKVTSFLSHFLSSCILHDRLALYCPLCGGTRALEAIFSLKIASALALNPFITLLFFAAIAWDIWALIRLLRGKNKLYRLPTWGWILLISVMLLYGIIRNVLLITAAYDPLGDLVGFWHA